MHPRAACDVYFLTQEAGGQLGGESRGGSPAMALISPQDPHTGSQGKQEPLPSPKPSLT